MHPIIKDLFFFDRKSCMVVCQITKVFRLFCLFHGQWTVGPSRQFLGVDSWFQIIINFTLHPAPPKIPGQDFHFFQARQCPGQTVHGQSMECKTFPKCWFYPFLSVDMCVVYIHFMIRICACIQLVIRNAQWPCLSITESVLQVG